MLIIRNQRSVSGGEQLLSLGNSDFIYRDLGIKGLVLGLLKILGIKLKRKERVVIFGAFSFRALCRDYLYLYILKYVKGCSVKILSRSSVSKSRLLASIFRSVVHQNKYDPIASFHFSERQLVYQKETAEVDGNTSFYFYFGRISSEKGLIRSCEYCKKVGKKFYCYGSIEDEKLFHKLKSFDNFIYKGKIAKEEVKSELRKLARQKGRGLLMSDYEGLSNFLTDLIQEKITYTIIPRAGYDVFVLSNVAKSLNMGLGLINRSMHHIWDTH